MEMKLFNQSIAWEKIILDTSVEQSVDCEITLPEYCPDILRILKCQIVPGIASTNVSGDRLTISGNSCLRLFYVDDCSTAVRCFQQQIPYEKIIDLGGNDCSSPFVKATLKLEFCNCRAVNQRRADVRASFSIKVRVSCQEVESLLVDCQGCGTQLKSKECEAVNRIGATCRTFTIEEVFDIGQGKPTIKNILNTGAVCCVNEVKVIPNKILVKGEVRVKVLYCPDSPEDEVQMVETVIPTSQIIDLDGITEDHLCHATINLGTLDICPKADLNGEYRMLEMTGKLFAEIVAYEKCDMKLITDVYSTDSNLICDEKIDEIPALLANVNERVLAKGEIDFGQLGISKIIDIYATGSTCNFKVVEQLIVLYGSVSLNVLFGGSDGDAAYIERNIDFEYNTGISNKGQSIDCQPEATPISLDYSITSMSTVDVRIEQIVKGVIISKSSEKFVTSISVDEDNPKQSSGAALTIYFASVNEPIWDIARKFNSTSQAICDENEITGDLVKCATMLMIPGV